MTHTLAGLTPGAVYRISVRSRNVEGYSVYSEYLEKAATNLPTAPTGLQKSSEKSTKTSIYLHWPKVAKEQVDTSGYLLWMATNAEGSDEFVLIMNGTDRPEMNEFNVVGL